MLQEASLGSPSDHQEQDNRPQRRFQTEAALARVSWIEVTMGGLGTKKAGLGISRIKGLYPWATEARNHEAGDLPGQGADEVGLKAVLEEQKIGG